MNNKAFTLVELIAIITIIAAIFLVSFPVLNSLNKSNKDNEYDLMVTNLCDSGKSYIYSDTSNYPELSTIGSTITINISDLITYGNVSANLKNPNTKNLVSGDTLTYTVASDSSLECRYNDN